jgi:localization factor PodJL
VETLAGRLSQARQDADAAAKALKDHLLAVDERLKTVEAADSAAEALSEMRTSLDGLSARMAEGEAVNAGALARLEDNIAQLQQAGEDKDAGPRLDAIEESLSALSARIDTPAVPETVSEELRQISERLDASDQHHRREIAELRESVEGLEAASKAEPEPEAQSQSVFADEAAAEPPLPMNAVMNGGANGQAQASGFDLPPFPAAAPEPGHETGFEAPPFPAASDEPQPFNAGTGYPNEHQFSGVQPFSTALGDGFDGATGNGFTPGQQSAEDFIANTRRQARAAADMHGDGAPMSSFAWSAGHSEEPEPKGASRFAMIALAVILIGGALAAGLYVFRGQARGPLSLLHRPAQSAATNATPPAPKPMAAQPQTPAQSQAQDDSTAAAPQESPAVAASQAAPTHKPVHARTHMHKTVAPAPAPASPHKTAAHSAARTAPSHATLSPLARLTNKAKSGNAAAETLLGLKYLNGDGVGTNEAEAARWLERAAKQGQPVAEYRLGTLYERGHGVPTNAALAVRWYERAASHGNRKAMHNLAVAYAQGAGVPKDFKKAALWFGRAARLGLRDSEFNLAVLYERGMGVRQNLGEAFKWYSIAARAGDAESKARVAALGPQLKPAARIAAQRAVARFAPAELNRAANAAPVLASH